MRLGIRQLEKLQTCGTAFSQVVPDRRVKKLIERGFMTSDNPDGSFAYITPQGLRALAEAIDNGRISIRKKTTVSKDG